MKEKLTKQINVLVVPIFCLFFLALCWINLDWIPDAYPDVLSLHILDWIRKENIKNLQVCLNRGRLPSTWPHHHMDVSSKKLPWWKFIAVKTVGLWETRTKVKQHLSLTPFPDLASLFLSQVSTSFSVYRAGRTGNEDWCQQQSAAPPSSYVLLAPIWVLPTGSSPSENVQPLSPGE